MGLGSVLMQHKKPKESKPKEAKAKEPKKPAAVSATAKESSSYKGSPLKVTIKNDAAPVPIEVVESPERKVLSVPSRSGKEPFQNLIIKKDLKQDVKESSSPSPAKKPTPALAQTKTLPPLPLPPLIDEDIHTPPEMKEEDKPRPKISDLPLPPLSSDGHRPKGGKKTRAEQKAESVAIQKKALILKRRAEITANMPNWGDRCVDKYEIITQIGEGTYGQVYKAKNKANGK